MGSYTEVRVSTTEAGSEAFGLSPADSVITYALSAAPTTPIVPSAENIQVDPLSSWESRVQDHVAQILSIIHDTLGPNVCRNFV